MWRARMIVKLKCNEKVSEVPRGVLCQHFLSEAKKMYYWQTKGPTVTS